MPRKRKTRVVHVECATAEGYRWLRMHRMGARVVNDGFEVYDEELWAQSLAAAGGKEIQ
jgi:hypothetical protein